MGQQILEKKFKWGLTLVVAFSVSFFLTVTFFNMEFVSSIRTINWISSRISTNQTTPDFAESKIRQAPPKREIPRFAYLISGSKGDLEKLWRTLSALYHPRNQYLVHLDLESPAEERLQLASRINNDSVFSQVGNVHMISRANLVTYRGPTMVANTLHACAILLKRSADWDWFINLSASDYPLVTQDDLIDAFSSLDRNVNIIEHTSKLGWKVDKRAMPLIIDPGLHQTNKSDVYWVMPRRSLPTAFKLFTGSAWMVLSRSFVEFMIWGWDNLPRTLLMYYTNFLSSPEGYFHTVVCNAPDYAKTVLNHDLHYISWDYPPKQHPLTLTINDTDKMIGSGAAFARKFRQNDPVLDKIDRELLGKKTRFTPGGWCAGKPECSEVGDLSMIKPGPGAQRLHELLKKLVLAAEQNGDQCR